MELPKEVTEIYDPKAQVRWKVLAYRKLTTEEAVKAIYVYLANCKKKDRPKKGYEVTVVTVIGADGTPF